MDVRLKAECPAAACRKDEKGRLGARPGTGLMPMPGAGMGLQVWRDEASPQRAGMVPSRFSRGGSGASPFSWNQMFSAMLVA